MRRVRPDSPTRAAPPSLVPLSLGLLLLLPACSSETTVQLPAESASGSTEPTQATFGDTLEYDGGLSLKTTPPERFGSASTDKDRQWTTTITVKNGTAGPYDPNEVYMGVTAGGSPKPCAPIFDEAAGLVFVRTTPLKAGATTSFDLGFSCHAERGTPIVADLKVTGRTGPGLAVTGELP